MWSAICIGCMSQTKEEKETRKGKTHFVKVRRSVGRQIDALFYTVAFYMMYTQIYCVRLSISIFRIPNPVLEGLGNTAIQVREKCLRVSISHVPMPMFSTQPVAFRPRHEVLDITVHIPSVTLGTFRLLPTVVVSWVSSITLRTCYGLSHGTPE